MLFKWKKTTEPAEFNPDTIKVTLKPILGVEPRIYVPAAWLALIFLLFFAALILPGIRRNGTWLTIYSNPPDSSVYVDGKRLGRSGKPVFVAKGIRNLQISRPGFKNYISERQFHGRVLASLIRPLQKEIYVNLEIEQDYPFWQTSITLFEAWSATGPEKRRYAIPPVLTSLGRDINSGPIDKQDIITAAQTLLPMARDERNLADVNRLFYQLVSTNSVANPVALVRYAVNALTVLEQNSMLDGVVRIAGQDLLPTRVSDIPMEVEEIDKFYRDVLTNHDFPKITAGNMEFVSIPALKAPIGDLELINSGNYLPRFGAIPVQTDTPAYSIAVQEVSNTSFAEFIRAVPQWAPANLDALKDAGHVDKDYLAGWKNGNPVPGEGDYPVTGISWYAAQAYTAWLTTRIFPEGGGTIRLPREDEWEIAARLNGQVKDVSELPGTLRRVSDTDNGNIGLSGLMGNVREWCLNPFRYSEQQFQPPEYLDPGNGKIGRARAVRGGAFIDKGPGLLYPVSARGYLDAGITSPAVGFRLVVTIEER